MIVMRPIEEAAVLDELDAGRFGGAAGGLQGYVVMEGPRYHGHALYRVEDGVTTLLECALDETPLVDGAARACVAAGENAGARAFTVRAGDAALAGWLRICCHGNTGNVPDLVPNDVLFAGCAGKKDGK